MALVISTLSATASAATLTTIHTFTGNQETASADGAFPMGRLLVAPSGVIYGTTSSGGPYICNFEEVSFYTCGTVFILTPPAASGDPWTEEVYGFHEDGVGSNPYAGLVARDGVLYGSTLNNFGTVFALVPPSVPGGQWSGKTLEGGPPQVVYPYDAPVMSASGVLYLTSWEGGPNDDSYGDVLSVAPPTSPGGSWTTTVLTTLSSPETGVVIGSGGVLFGTLYNTVYSVSPPASEGGAWTLTTLYAFAGPPNDGLLSSGTVVIGSDGVLYGSTSIGGTGGAGPCPINVPTGAGGCGIVYSLTPPAAAGGTWTEKVLYNFQGGDDGQAPGTMVIGPGGVLYGCTSGGASNAGTIFSLRPPTSPGGTWTKTLLYAFTGGDDGADPQGVVLGPGNALYGNTYGGGSSYHGTVFQLTP